MLLLLIVALVGLGAWEALAWLAALLLVDRQICQRKWLRCCIDIWKKGW